MLFSPRKTTTAFEEYRRAKAGFAFVAVAGSALLLYMLLRQDAPIAIAVIGLIDGCSIMAAASIGLIMRYAHLIDVLLAANDSLAATNSGLQRRIDEPNEVLAPRTFPFQKPSS
jgi:hypothetical protein